MTDQLEQQTPPPPSNPALAQWQYQPYRAQPLATPSKRSRRRPSLKWTAVAVAGLLGGAFAVKQQFFQDSDSGAPPAASAAATADPLSTQPPTEAPSNAAPLGNIDPSTLRRIEAPPAENTMLAGRDTGWTMTIPSTWTQADPGAFDTSLVFLSPNGGADTLSIWIEPAVPGEALADLASRYAEKMDASSVSFQVISAEVVVTATGGYAVRNEAAAAADGELRNLVYAVSDGSRVVVASSVISQYSHPDYASVIERYIATLALPSVPVLGPGATSTGNHVKVDLPVMISDPGILGTPASLPVPAAPTEGTTYFDASGFALTVAADWTSPATATWQLPTDANGVRGIVVIDSLPTQAADLASHLAAMERSLLSELEGSIIENGIMAMPDGRLIAKVVLQTADDQTRIQRWLIVKDGVGTVISAAIPIATWEQQGPLIESYLATITRP